MAIDSTFPTKLDTVSDAPEPLRTSLLEGLPSEEPFRLLVHSPVFPTGDEKSPATVLGVTNHGWLLVSENEDGRTTLQKSGFDEILFLELRSILLLGRLRICFAAASSATVKFDAVGDEYYYEAIELLLAGIDPARVAAAEKNQDAASMFADWPLKFRNEAKRYWPRGQRLLAAVRWPATSELQRQVAPAGALLITERELVLIADEKEPSAAPLPDAPSAEKPTESRSDREAGETAEALEKGNRPEPASDPVIQTTEVDPGKLPGDVYEFSEIVTFVPRVRLADFHLRHQEQSCVLALRLHATHGGAVLEVMFPSDAETSVLKAMEQWSLPGGSAI